MSNKKNKNKKISASEKPLLEESLSTIGDALRELSPDMAIRFKALQGVESPAEWVMEVIFDLFPYAWKDTELLGEAIINIFACEFDEAAESLKGAIEMNPDAYPAYHLLGHVYGCMGNYKEEIECYRKIIKLRNDYPHLHYSLGMSYWLAGRKKKAMAEFHVAIPMIAEFAIPEFWFAFTFEKLNRYPAKNNGTGDKNTIEKKRVLSQLFYMIGLELIEYGHNSEARQAFKKSIQLRPEFAEAYCQLGFVHIKKLRNSKRAEKYLQTAEHLLQERKELQRAKLIHQICNSSDLPKDKNKAAEDWLKEGLRLQQLGLNQGAVDAYKIAISFKRDFLDAYYNMGIAYGSLEEAGVDVLDNALGALKQSVRLNSDFIHGYIALGAAYIRKEDYESALDALERAILINSKDPNAHYYMGVVCRATKKFEKAAASLHNSVLLKPDSLQMQYFLGLVLIDCEKFQRACDALNEAVRIKPGFAEGHYMLGYVYLKKLFDVEKGVYHLSKAEKLYIKLEDFDRLEKVRAMLAK